MSTGTVYTTPPIMPLTFISANNGSVSDFLNDPTCRGEAAKRGIDTSEPMRFFLTSDYQVGKGGSASAERMLKTAHDLASVGHEVVLFAPSYTEKVDIAKDANFIIHPILFKPANDPTWRSGGAPFLGFDIPAFDKSRSLSTRHLFAHLPGDDLDQLLMAYSAHLFFGRILYGEPRVVITSHCNSPWNYVASNYPLVAFTSDSDVIPEGASNSVTRIMQQGAERVFKIISFSRVTADGKTFSAPPSGGIDEKKVHRVRLDIDMSCFSHQGQPTKEETVLKYGNELKDVSMHDRWVVLYDRSHQPDIERYLISLASEIMRTCRGVTCIAIKERDDSFGIASGIRRAPDLRVIEVDDNMKKMLMSAADAALVYVGGEGPPRDMDKMQRDVKISTKTALVMKSGDSRRVYFPAQHFNSTSDEVLTFANIDFRTHFAHLDDNVLQAVLSRLTPKDDPDVEDVAAPDADIQKMADRAIALALRNITTRLFTLAAGTGKIEPEMGTWDDGRDSDIPPAKAKDALTYLEPLLYEAAIKGWLEASLKYVEPTFNSARQTRLNNIEYRSETRIDWDTLVHDLNSANISHLALSLNNWMESVLRAMHIDNFRPSIKARAIHDPRKHPNGILDEIARVTGVTSKDIFNNANRLAVLPPAVFTIREEKASDDDFGIEAPPPTTGQRVVQMIGSAVREALSKKKRDS